MAGGKDRANWDAGRQVRESQLRTALLARGIEIPRYCSTCQAALEVFRDGQKALVVRCAGRCGRVEQPNALRDMRRAGAATLPGFE
jgi:hypothetical protein